MVHQTNTNNPIDFPKVNQQRDIKKDFKEVAIGFSQEGDTNSSNLRNYITVKSESPVGGDNYIVISTERWAIDIDELPQFIEMLKEVLK